VVDHPLRSKVLASCVFTKVFFFLLTGVALVCFTLSNLCGISKQWKCRVQEEENERSNVNMLYFDRTSDTVSHKIQCKNCLCNLMLNEVEVLLGPGLEAQAGEKTEVI